MSMSQILFSRSLHVACLAGCSLLACGDDMAVGSGGAGAPGGPGGGSACTANTAQPGGACTESPLFARQLFG